MARVQVQLARAVETAIPQVFSTTRMAGKDIGLLAPVEADAWRCSAVGAGGVFRAGTQVLRDRDGN